MTEGRKSWAMTTGCSSSSDDRLSGEEEEASWSSTGPASTRWGSAFGSGSGSRSGSALGGGVMGGEEESVLFCTAPSSFEVAVLSLLVESAAAAFVWLCAGVAADGCSGREVSQGMVEAGMLSVAPFDAFMVWAGTERGGELGERVARARGGRR